MSSLYRGFQLWRWLSLLPFLWLSECLPGIPLLVLLFLDFLNEFSRGRTFYFMISCPQEPLFLFFYGSLIFYFTSGGPSLPCCAQAYPDHGGRPQPWLRNPPRAPQVPLAGCGAHAQQFPCLMESPQTRSWGRFLPAILPEKSPSSRFHSLCSEILPSQETPSRPVYPLRLPRVARSGLPGLFVFSQHLGTLSGLSLSLSY